MGIIDLSRQLLPSAIALCLALPVAAETTLCETGPGGAIPRDMVDVWFAGRQVNGETAAGVPWVLEMSRAAAADTNGPARFRMDGGTWAEGQWRLDGDRLCQSYTGGANWACHEM